MFGLRKSTAKSSARQQIAIKGVRDGILSLPDNNYRSILSVSALNFELKSDEEQDAIIDTYESFLNSIGCPIQILVRTREIDMDDYLENLNNRLSGETTQIYRDQLKHYGEFLHSLITNNKILTRHFYIIIPYHPNGNTDFELIQEQLKLRTDIVSKGIARLGMRTEMLNSLEVLDLFYSFYSQDQSKIQPLTEHILQAIHSELVRHGAKYDDQER